MNGVSVAAVPRCRLMTVPIRNSNAPCPLRSRHAGKSLAGWIEMTLTTCVSCKGGCAELRRLPKEYVREPGASCRKVVRVPRFVAATKFVVEAKGPAKRAPLRDGVRLAVSSREVG